MPPQQAYGLLDFVDNVLRFRAHDILLLLAGFGPKRPIESARTIGSSLSPVK